MKILIAEDDAIMRTLIEHQLKKDNFSVYIASDGNEAMSVVDDFNPDLVITDIVMPLTSGLEFIGHIRSGGLKIPVLVLSAMNQENIVMEALALGADDFITKPFNPAKLTMRVKKLLEHSKA